MFEVRSKLRGASAERSVRWVIPSHDRGRMRRWWDRVNGRFERGAHGWRPFMPAELVAVLGLITVAVAFDTFETAWMMHEAPSAAAAPNGALAAVVRYDRQNPADVDAGPSRSLGDYVESAGVALQYWEGVGAIGWRTPSTPLVGGASRPDSSEDATARLRQDAEAVSSVRAGESAERARTR